MNLKPQHNINSNNISNNNSNCCYPRDDNKHSGWEIIISQISQRIPPERDLESGQRVIGRVTLREQIRLTFFDLKMTSLMLQVHSMNWGLGMKNPSRSTRSFNETNSSFGTNLGSNVITESIKFLTL